MMKSLRVIGMVGLLGIVRLDAESAAEPPAPELERLIAPKPEYRLPRAINHAHKQCAWREADVSIEHLDNQGELTGITQMKIKADVWLNSRVYRQGPGEETTPVVIELSEVTVTHRMGGESEPSYHFASDVSYQFQRELWHQLFRFNAALKTPIGVSVSNTGLLEYAFYDDSQDRTQIDRNHMDLIRTAARFIVRECEFAFAATDINREQERKTAFHHYDGEIPGHYIGVMQEETISSGQPELADPRRKLRDEGGKLHAVFVPTDPPPEFSAVEEQNSSLISGKLNGVAGVWWLEQAGLDCQIDEVIRVTDVQDRVWDPETPWHICHNGIVRICLRTYPPRR